MPYDSPSTIDPDGRRVVFDAGSHLHLVDFSEEPAWIVTAVVQDNDPRG
jgi:hypothetical protein